MDHNEQPETWARLAQFLTDNAVEIAVAFISLSAVIIAIRADRRDHSARIFELRKRWEEVHDQWTWCVLCRRGPDDYYADANPQMRKRLRKEIRIYRRSNITHQMNMMRGYTRDLREVARFFSYVADEVVNGNVSVREVYAILGPEVARHRAVCYWIAGLGDSGVELDFLDPLGDDDWELGLSQVPENVFHEQSARLGLLYELLWSEMARRGDMYAHRILERARWIDKNDQPREHRRWLRVVGHGPFDLFRRARMLLQLRFAYHVRIGAIQRDPDPILFKGYERYVRRIRLVPTRYDPRLRQLKHNVASFDF